MSSRDGAGQPTSYRYSRGWRLFTVIILRPGLRHDALSPFETLAQSVSTMAPTATPVATIPLVCALAGNGTCN